MILSSPTISLIRLLIASICSSVNSTRTPNSTGREVPQSPRQEAAQSPQSPQSQQQPQLSSDNWQFDPQFGLKKDKDKPADGMDPTTEKLLDDLFAYNPPADWDNTAVGGLHQEIGDYFLGKDSHQIHNFQQAEINSHHHHHQIAATSLIEEKEEELRQIQPPHLTSHMEKNRRTDGSSAKSNIAQGGGGKDKSISENANPHSKVSVEFGQEEANSPAAPQQQIGTMEEASPMENLIGQASPSVDGKERRRVGVQKNIKFKINTPKRTAIKMSPEMANSSVTAGKTASRHELDTLEEAPPSPHSSALPHPPFRHPSLPHPHPPSTSPPSSRPRPHSFGLMGGLPVKNFSSFVVHKPRTGFRRRKASYPNIRVSAVQTSPPSAIGTNWGRTSGSRKKSAKSKKKEHAYHNEYVENRNVEIAKMKKYLQTEFRDIPPIEDDVVMRLKYDLMRRDILWLEHLLREQNQAENNDSLVDSENASQKALKHYIKNAEENELEMPQEMLNLGLEGEEDNANRKEPRPVSMMVKAEQHLLIILPKQFILKMPRFVVHFAYDLAEIYRESLEQNYLKMDENLMKTPDHFMPEILQVLKANDDDELLPIDIDRAEYEQLDPTKTDEQHERYFKYIVKKGKKYAKCRICKNDLSRAGGSTSGINSHLKTHPQLAQIYARAKKQELKQNQPEGGIIVPVNFITSKTPNKDGSTKLLGKRKDAFITNTKKDGKTKTAKEELEEMKIPNEYIRIHRKMLDTYRRTILMLEEILLDKQNEIRNKYGPLTIDHYIKNAEGNKQINTMPREMFELDLGEVKNKKNSRKIQRISKQAKARVKPKNSATKSYNLVHLKQLELFAALPKLYQMQMPKLQFMLILPLAQKYRNNLKGFLEEDYLVELRSDYWKTKLLQEDKEKGPEDGGENEDEEDNEDEWGEENDAEGGSQDYENYEDDEDGNYYEDDEDDDDGENYENYEKDEEPYAYASQSRSLMVNGKEVHLTKRRKKN